ncbi:hypothetical protein [Thermococcus sp. 21S9]|uniref:hypothetical protein n=1 Tax=Thermococcus sp. 21S9 TaxID=1638223 RepID=UPI001439D116|nr:hypothetical protein [Thermococcus sp. 21S9]NJE55488.1 hypothetical protein [Thermococcus sp. 21S9]
MIALTLGLIVGLGTALVLGKLKDRKSELAVSFLLPLLTYEMANGIYGGFGDYVYFSTPLGDFTTSEFIGLQTFLAWLIMLVYVRIRGRGAFEIDEFPSLFAFFWAITAFGLGLSASAWPALALPGLIIYALLAWRGWKNPFWILNARPCSGELEELSRKLGLGCLTDEKSYGVYNFEGTLLVGGRLREFPRWKKLIECVAKVREPGRNVNLFLHAIYLSAVPIGVLLGRGITTMLPLLILLLLSYYTTLKLSVSLTRRALRGECRAIAKEYAEFFKEKKRKRRGFIVD